MQIYYLMNNECVQIPQKYNVTVFSIITGPMHTSYVINTECVQIPQSIMLLFLSITWPMQNLLFNEYWMRTDTAKYNVTVFNHYMANASSQYN